MTDELGRAATDIMFSESFMDLIDKIYLNSPQEILAFESEPKKYFAEHAIILPDALKVIIHTPGAPGKPARIDFHWADRPEAARHEGTDRAAMLSARRVYRERARRAFELLHSLEMIRFRQEALTSKEAAQKCAANPKEHLADHGIHVPDEFEVIVHLRDGKPEIHIHFSSPGPVNQARAAEVLVGCCYCYPDGDCCIYQL